MENLVTQNVMHASLCHMTSVGVGGGTGEWDRLGKWGGQVRETGGGTGGMILLAGCL